MLDDSSAKVFVSRGVSAEQNAPSISLDEIAIVTAMSVALLSRAPVFHLKGADSESSRQAVLRISFAPAKFSDVSETCPS